MLENEGAQLSLPQFRAQVLTEKKKNRGHLFPQFLGARTVRLVGRVPPPGIF